MRKAERVSERQLKTCTFSKATIRKRSALRASNSLQLDETIGLYCARLTGEEKHLAMINNRHPLVPHSTLAAGFRLMLHGLSSEVLHGFLVQMKKRSEGAISAPVRAVRARSRA